MMWMIAICLLLCLPTVTAGQGGVEGETEAETALAAAVRIAGTRNETPVSGSGFVVGLESDVATIVTASHVIEGTLFEVTFAGSTESFPPQSPLLGIDAGNLNGLAVFEVRGAIPRGIQALALDAVTRPWPGESLLLVGFPQRSRTPLAKRRTFSGRSGPLLQIDLPVGEGFSGGPVIRGGKVVGVVTGEDAQLTTALNAFAAREALLGWGARLGPVVAREPAGEPVSPPQVSQDAPRPELEGCRFGEETEFNGIVFVRVCSDYFTMGSADDDPLAFDNEKPAHRVTLSGYWICKFEVTSEQYRRFRPDHTGYAKLPAVNVSWNDAKAFCERFGFRLPTEAEWEFAARAGSRTRWSLGDDAKDLGRVAWYDSNSGGQSHPVGEKNPNAWGIHDMHGNVWEWVADWIGPYSAGAKTDPTGPSGGLLRGLRGGASGFEPRVLRSSFRGGSEPDDGFGDFGFRCARDLRRQP